MLYLKSYVSIAVGKLSWCIQDTSRGCVRGHSCVINMLLSWQWVCTDRLLCQQWIYWSGIKWKPTNTTSISKGKFFSIEIQKLINTIWLESFDMELIWWLMISIATIKLISIYNNFPHLKDSHVLSFCQILICHLKYKLEAISSNYIPVIISSHTEFCKFI